MAEYSSAKKNCTGQISHPALNREQSFLSINTMENLYILFKSYRCLTAQKAKETLGYVQCCDWLKFSFQNMFHTKGRKLSLHRKHPVRVPTEKLSVLQQASFVDLLPNSFWETDHVRSVICCRADD